MPPTRRRHRRRDRRDRRERGVTLLELAIVLAVTGILVGLGAPSLRRLMDAAEVRGATQESVALFAMARHVAIWRGRTATVRIDAPGSRLVLLSGADTVRVRELGRIHGVRLAATRRELTYAANGLGYGATNLRLTIARGRATDTVFVSRLGRVRH